MKPLLLTGIAFILFNITFAQAPVKKALPDKTFTVDGYPVTNKMFGHERILTSGEIISSDYEWFANDRLQQTLVFELYTDYHRMITYHFYNSEALEIAKVMELHILGDEYATLVQKQKYFAGFIKQANRISTPYFTSDKGFQLGDGKDKAIATYGKPDSVKTVKQLEIYKWHYAGDTDTGRTPAVKGRPLAKNSFGHDITMFFKNDKLVAIILHNDIP